ncbi:hypothetical protein AWI62_24900 [Salmonella enterica]|uniref:Uncharacterized protein n=1 Tax=Salmonella diarizonae TaxID=59204 RepID=A0A635JDW5_SALDZ|nr:hypothetical protein [Salmonella enterica]EDH7458417.1 hypothetical protein [Salmonella enterica subsp. diarizonae]EDR1382588.1 hypothetical protein [Salmonella enterica subsp. diarizonae serovar 61:r:z53]EDR5597245.1 hypothetical protein [Salmonella enterica subsp. diarizonae]EEJ5472030.1 hypothetical protein [Salmonella enterica subsp. diarizonae]
MPRRSAALSVILRVKCCDLMVMAVYLRLMRREKLAGILQSILRRYAVEIKGRGQDELQTLKILCENC